MLPGDNGYRLGLPRGQPLVESRVQEPRVRERGPVLLVQLQGLPRVTAVTDHLALPAYWLTAVHPWQPKPRGASGK